MKENAKTIEVVISGISGRFPESSSVKEFISHLLANHDLVTSTNRRYKAGLYGLPKGFGSLKEIDKFDANFFGILPKQADCMDPQLRIGLETTYEAMFDAGVNPADERGSRTGVYTAIISHEGTELWARIPETMDGTNMINTVGAMIPNRISYCFDFNGPSANYDTACSSSIFAMDAAITAIQTGKCDSAVVMGACLIFNPSQSLMRFQAGMLAKDSVSRCFDSDGLGYVRAEAIATIYLQKKCDAKKSYATIVGIGTNTDGYKEIGIFHPSAKMQEKLLSEVYLKAGVDPGEVVYLEAHGTGTPAGDPEELKAIERHFCLNRNRQKPLLVGSVKSNMGHAEGASGLCSIAKIVSILQNGWIPANLNYEKPYFSMKSIRAGKVEIVNTNTKFDGGYIALNNFGFGGVNTHIILKPTEPQFKSHSYNGTSNGNGTYLDPKPKISHLVTLEGRTREGVETNLKELMESEGNTDQRYLLNEIQKTSTRGKFRGYGIIQSEIIDIQQVSSARPPLWFVLNGMGSQWTGMGRSLFQIPAFQSAFDLCAQALAPYNYNLKDIYFSDDPNILDTPTNAFACIGVTQIGLIDILSLIGLKPDGFFGHSLGESLCAYLDGCMTLQETIVSIYLRGKPSEDLKATLTHPYGMAVVNLEANTVRNWCQNGLTVACHNGSTSTTVSGPTDLIDELDEKLTKAGYVVRMVNSCGLAFHSPYVAPAAEAYYKEIKTFLKNSARTHRWISTSVPQDKVTQYEGKLFGPEYLLNNFLSPVLFAQALKYIPSDSVVLEIGASGLLRGLIQTDTKDATVISLQARNTDSLATLQKALGRLFVSGINFNLNALTEQVVQRPLPACTPLLGHLVDWDHSTSWKVPDYAKDAGDGSGVFEVCLARKEDQYLEGHMLSKRVLFPASGYINFVWKHFAASLQLDLDDCPVIFEDIKLLRATVIRASDVTEYHIYLFPASGSFEIRDQNVAVCTGKIRLLPNVEDKTSESKFVEIEKAGRTKLSKLEEIQTTNDIYRRLRFLGYEYGGEFKGIERADLTGTHFFLKRNSNLVPFIDTMLQTGIRIYDAKTLQKALLVPTEISKVVIKPEKLRCNDKPENSSVYVHYDHLNWNAKCWGLEIEGVKMTRMRLSREHDGATKISHYAFDPYVYMNCDELKNDRFTPLLLCLSIVMENFNTFQGKVIRSVPVIFELSMDGRNSEAIQISQAIRCHFATPEINYTLYSNLSLSDGILKSLKLNHVKYQSMEDSLTNFDWMTKKYDLIVIEQAMLMRKLLSGLRKGGFLILKTIRGELTRAGVEKQLETDEDQYYLISHKFCRNFDVFLIRKSTNKRKNAVKVISIDSSTSWVNILATEVDRQEQDLEHGVTSCPRIFLVSTGENSHDSGIVGLTLCLRKEPYCQNFRCIYSRQPLQLDFNQPDNILQEILDKDLVFNVIDDNGRLGCYCHSAVSSNHNVSLSESAYVGIGTPGDLSTLGWYQGLELESLPPLDGLSPVDVYAAGLNFKDMMISSGNLPPVISTSGYPHFHQSPIGFEFSGMTKNGQRVCGVTSVQAIATHVLATDQLMWDIPPEWTFEEATTVPAAYLTAYLALVTRGQLMQNETVLIHQGASSVGIAAIRIALSYKCKVFTTVSSTRKINYLQTTFPEIPESHIRYSRDTRFEHELLTLTDGRGIDVILNATAGELLFSSIKCLAQHGRFLEIGRRDLIRNANLGMDLFLRDVSFHGIQLDLFLRDGHAEARNKLRSLLQQGINSGVVVPLPYRAFLPDQIEPAFRFMGQGSHIGKVVITVRPREQIKPIKILVKPKVYFVSNKSYIITGGLGGVGLELINWMTLRNARHILITSRTGKITQYIRAYLKIWKERGINVKIVAKNVINTEEAKEVFSDAMKMGPIGGIFNLSGHTEIKLMKSQTTELFQKVIDPKITTTKVLDELSRTLCPDLDHFVVFSSISSAIGFDGQTNYGFANSGTERIVENRIRDGFPGRAIQWGAIGEVGMWHETYNQDFKRTSFHGSGIQSLDSVFADLDILLTLPGPPVTFCRKELNLDDKGGDSRVQLADTNIVERVARILGHSSASKLNTNDKLVDLGMDSIMSMEVMHVLKEEFGMELTAADIRSYTLQELKTVADNNRNKETTISSEIPTAKLATAGLVQFNLFKSFTKSRYLHSEALYPINQLATDGAQVEGQATVLICNSVEGPDVLRVLGSLIKAPCYSLQFSGLVGKVKSFADVAQHFFESISKANLQGPFIIAGLSAGVFPGYELALKFQEMGMILNFIWMDMTFDRFKAIVSENFGGATDLNEISDDDILVFVNSHVFGFDKDLLVKLLRNETTREDKVKRIMELLRGFYEDADEDEEAIRNIFYEDWRPILTLLDNFVPSGKFHQETALIKTTQLLMAYDTGEFWGLEKICTKIPQVLTVDTTHSYMIAEPAARDVANLINDILSNQLSSDL